MTQIVGRETHRRRCAHCDGPLPTQNPSRKFCSARCRVRSWQIAHPGYRGPLAATQVVKARARAKAGVYQRRGLLVPQPCEHAGEDCRGPIEKHHDDYSRPLDVRWFCRYHHARLERRKAALRR